MRTLTLILLTAGLSPVLAETILEIPAGESLATARDKVRALRQSGNDGVIRVKLAPGIREIAQPVQFEGEQDSGRENGPTIYEGEGVVILGGRRLEGWNKDGEKWTVQVREGSFEQLWINGRRAIRARTPNAVESDSGAINGAYFSAKSQAGAGTFPDMKEPSFEAFIARPEDYPVLRSITDVERPGALLTVMQTWTVSQCRIAALNDQAKAVRIVGKSRYPFVQFEPDQRWYVENFEAALDVPGEWHLAPYGTLRYIPRIGEDMLRAEVIAPVATQWLTVKGARHLVFRGITFEYAGQAFDADGHHDGQAASGIGAAIELDKAEKVHFEGVTLRHTGNHGIWFRDQCRDCSLTRSLIEDTGGGAVRIGITNMPAEGAHTQRIVVENCILRRGGRVFPSACGVMVAQASDCMVRHCDIVDFYYTGISAGWVWGYAHSPAKRNRFDFNHIHHLGWGVLSDMGGFYGLGRAEGTTVSGNYVHDVASYRYGGWGLYTDEGSTGVTMENNLVHDTSESTFHQHYGKWNRIANNIFAFGRKAQIQRTRPEPHASFDYQRNIVLYDNTKLLDGSWYNWETGTYEMNHNLYWSVSGPVSFIDTDLAGWQKRSGRDTESRVADPLFVDAAKRDFRLQPESPAKALGFVPFDHTKAGVRGDPAWTAKAKEGDHGDFWKHSTPWPQPGFAISEDFESMDIGMPTLPRQNIDWRNKGDSIAVTEDAASTGKRSLKFTDAPGLDPVWLPLLQFAPGYTSGTVRISFDLRLGEGAQGYIECRTSGHPFRTGPSIGFDKGVIAARLNPVQTRPKQGDWTRVTITARMGAGTWQWNMTPPGEPLPEPANLNCDKAWTECGWIGFVSTADAKSEWWIDNLVITRAE